MKVHELITQLQKFDPNYDVHLDVSASDITGWEGDRVVRHVDSLRVQDGFFAVAIDAMSCEQTSEKGFD